jgi:uncharacterized protein
VRAVFADTFYWAALTWTKDPAHQRALEFSRTFDAGLIITIDEVLSEYLTFFAGADPILHAKAESFLSGLELYRARPDKGYSLTDCISMQTMQREGLSDALTNDRHFEQEGFHALFRD